MGLRPSISAHVPLANIEGHPYREEGLFLRSHRCDPDETHEGCQSTWFRIAHLQQPNLLRSNVSVGQFRQHLRGWGIHSRTKGTGSAVPY
jgi:hypothetical protein